MASATVQQTSPVVPAIRVEVPDVKVSLVDDTPSPSQKTESLKNKEKLVLKVVPNNNKDNDSSKTHKSEYSSSSDDSNSNLPELARRRSPSTSSSFSRSDTLPLYAPPSPAPKYEKSISSPSHLQLPSPTQRSFAQCNDDARSINRPASPCRSTKSEAPTYRSHEEGGDDGIKLYHVYRVWEHYTFHTAPDSILDDLPRYKRSKDGISEPVDYKPSWSQRFFLPMHKNGRLPDNPKRDPRMADYYMHSPHLLCGKSHQTLRVGPNRRAPVGCSVNSTKWWKQYTIDFTDLNGEGIINEKGLINGRHYSYFDRRKYNKTQKSSSSQEKDAEKPEEIEKEPEQKLVRKQSFAKKLFRVNSAPPSSIGKEKTPVTKLPPPRLTRAATVPVIPKTKPEDLVTMNCKPTTKSVRKYDFEYNGVKFYWKGTGTTRHESNKVLRPWYRYAHLKLVAEIPVNEHHTQNILTKGKGGQKKVDKKQENKKQKKQTPNPETKEVVLAVYTCGFGKRKCGRLAMYEKNIDDILRYMRNCKPENTSESKSNTTITPPSTPPSSSSSSSSSPSSPCSTASSSSSSSSSTFAPSLQPNSSQNDLSTTTTAVSFSEPPSQPVVDDYAPRGPTNRKSAIVWPRPSTTKPVGEAVQQRERMVQLIVATTICMLDQERQKREFISELLNFILDMALIPI